MVQYSHTIQVLKEYYDNKVPINTKQTILIKENRYGVLLEDNKKFKIIRDSEDSDLGNKQIYLKIEKLLLKMIISLTIFKL